jgi:hypothetical protein
VWEASGSGAVTSVVHGDAEREVTGCGMVAWARCALFTDDRLQAWDEADELMLVVGREVAEVGTVLLGVHECTSRRPWTSPPLA